MHFLFLFLLSMFLLVENVFSSELERSNVKNHQTLTTTDKQTNKQKAFATFDKRKGVSFSFQKTMEKFSCGLGVRLYESDPAASVGVFSFCDIPLMRKQVSYSIVPAITFEWDTGDSEYLKKPKVRLFGNGFLTKLNLYWFPTQKGQWVFRVGYGIGQLKNKERYFGRDEIRYDVRQSGVVVGFANYF